MHIIRQAQKWPRNISTQIPLENGPRKSIETNSVDEMNISCKGVCGILSSLYLIYKVHDKTKFLVSLKNPDQSNFWINFLLDISYTEVGHMAGTKNLGSLKHEAL